MIPIRIPTVVTDAWSNCRIVIAIKIQIAPKTSHSHQRLVMLLVALCGVGDVEASIY